jgi:redox-sensitive bicupin YhaK (pirin superfamily)
MSAGTGVLHSDFNASKTEPVHFLQIWIVPSAAGIAPGYEQKTFTPEEKRGRLRLVASTDGRDGSVTIHADAALYAGVFGKGESAERPIATGRHAWVHVARGNARVNGRELGAGDAVGISDEKNVRVEGIDDGEVLLFDLA